MILINLLTCCIIYRKTSVSLLIDIKNDAKRQVYEGNATFKTDTREESLPKSIFSENFNFILQKGNTEK